MYFVLGDDIKSSVMSTALMVLHGGITRNSGVWEVSYSHHHDEWRRKQFIFTYSYNARTSDPGPWVITIQHRYLFNLQPLPVTICNLYVPIHSLIPPPHPSAALTCCHPQHSPMLPLTTSPKTINNHYLSSSITVICDQRLLHTSLTTTNAGHSA